MHNIKITFDKILSTLKQIVVDDPALLKTQVRPGPKHYFTDLDIIALSITADSIGLNSENNLFHALNSDYKQDFPNLISRRQYNDRRNRLKDKIIQLKELVTSKIRNKRKTQDIYIVDSMPLEICRYSRKHSSTICKDDEMLLPDIGYCAAQEEWYYGYKLHMICTGEGAIKSIKIGNAKMHDVHYLDDLGEELRGCRLVGDKGYISQSRKQQLFDNYQIQLETPYRANQKQIKPFIYGPVRKRIETVFSQLNDQFNIQRNYAKSIKGYLTRIYSKLCSMSLLQYINKINDRPIGKIKNALKYSIKI